MRILEINGSSLVGNLAMRVKKADPKLMATVITT